MGAYTVPACAAPAFKAARAGLSPCPFCIRCLCQGLASGALSRTSQCSLAGDMARAIVKLLLRCRFIPWAYNQTSIIPPIIHDWWYCTPNTAGAMGQPKYKAHTYTVYAPPNRNSIAAHEQRDCLVYALTACLCATSACLWPFIHPPVPRRQHGHQTHRPGYVVRSRATVAMLEGV